MLCIPVVVTVTILMLCIYWFYDRETKFGDVNNAILSEDGVLGISENSRIHVTSEWLLANLYRCANFADEEDGTYTVSLHVIEQAKPCSFNELKELFLSTLYTSTNHSILSEGVNCQGMTIYLADWCRLTGHAFEIEYFPTHVAIVIIDNGSRYRFNFTLSPSITKL